ncbi:hypothetical protein KY290_029003 [Solanum tuberosum]|uniref:DC1 domain-containing protein n=1 Tax=Solanum tuberosum TaxID=4113 RepID=A0ABQ7UJI9_SOLTU|nr:hypothetical protein KY290_029003 [Solanum tuberosum]
MGRVKLNNDPTSSLKHFSHPHELELCTQLQDLIPCSGCRLPPSGQMYICRPCNFTLHLSCAKFPQLITHPSHPNHPLNLLPMSKYPGGQFNCDACKRHGTGFSYHCSYCEFDLHVICASRPLKITHELHQCSLELTFKNPYANAKGFSCDVCCKIGVKQWLYRCPACEFDVHLDCLTSPPRQEASQSTALQHHHSFPGAPNQFQQVTVGRQARSHHLMHAASTGAITNNHSLQPTVFQGQARPNQLFHSASTSAVPQQQFLQPPIIQGQARPNQLFHSASTSAVPQQQFLQPTTIQGQVRPNQYMQTPGANSGFGNNLMNAAIQGLVGGAAQQVGQTFMQGIIGGGDNNGGNEGSSILGGIFGDSSDTQY